MNEYWKNKDSYLFSDNKFNKFLEKVEKPVEK